MKCHDMSIAVMRDVMRKTSCQAFKAARKQAALCFARPDDNDVGEYQALRRVQSLAAMCKARPRDEVQAVEAFLLRNEWRAWWRPNALQAH
eukprot:7124638-Alexandrium_andersonii.AAC.1